MTTQLAKRLSYYTVETTYMLPVYRQQTYLAPSLAAACELAVADDDWEHAENSYDGSGPIHVTGLWRGDRAYVDADALPIPATFADPADGAGK
ncbi:MAG TPA: hypothetical protein VGR63_15390 [Casimicrobiaceae bacterium]|jgi:hypothetical protein|nr:hypothetical protein [Casimicrobiaceae bacterium]